MYKILLTILVLTSCSQIDKKTTDKESTTQTEAIIDLENYVFNFAPELDMGKCKSTGNCDCCSSDLCLIDKKRFFLISYCVSDMDITSGKYSISNDFLTLNFDTTSIERKYNWDYEFSQTDSMYFLREEKIEKRETQLILAVCGDNPMLKFEHSEGTEFGTISNGENALDKLRFLKEIGIFEKLTKTLRQPLE